MQTTTTLQRVALLDKVVIPHPSWAQAMQGIQDCVAKSEVYREPVGSLLLADGGMGKTTVCRAILAQMPSTTKVEQRLEKTLIPAFYAEVPSPATVKTVAASLLARLNDPSPLAGNTAQMTQRLCRLLGACETKLVLLDEFHHLFDIRKTSTRINSNVCNWIKSLVNETKVTFCLVGLPQFAPILAIDSQLARRFPLEFSLPPLRVGTTAEPGALLLFLAQIKHTLLHKLQFQAVPHLDRHDIALQIYAATGGSPAFVMALVKEAVRFALDAQSNQLTLEDFVLAWDAGITAKASLSRDNPFKGSPATLAAALREGR
ncbi:TniB family NTP-binding protein [Chitinilyticum litopenaei]|uniref:TniB family NTP-binding protein n=1 Tax=Chitinilyticum litopenaei TaxID=1121276 RepID=UPI0005BC879B|nr:TniB family NTP-binding protein [Chitinilyticum litopenaei]